MHNAAHEHLIELHKMHGQLTPEMVVSDAKKKTSPLHALFEWDQKKAAEQHWLDTARTLIRSVKVEVVNEATILRAPYFVRDPRLPAAKQGYVSTAEVRNDADLARDVVADECSRALAAFRRAKEVAAAVGEGMSVEELMRATTDLQARVVRAAEPA